MKLLSYFIKNIVSKDDLIIKELKYEEIPISEIDHSIFTEEESFRFASFISNKRRREFYFTRVLLQSFLPHAKLSYESTGRPTISEGHLSISHSQNTIIIGFSESLIIGVDIEFFNEKIHVIKHKFLSSYESQHFDISNMEILTLIWSLKEAIYKMEDIQGLIFKDHIIVQSLSHRGEVNVLKNDQKSRYLFDYQVFNNKVITYCQLIP